MNIAYDLFAETNPAYGTFGLVAFSRKFIATSGQKAPALALAYLMLPIALSDDLDASFVETAATTGLLSWLNRYPDVLLDLGVRLDASKEIVTAAVRFGVGSRSLAIEREGTMVPGPRAPSASRVNNVPEDTKRALKRAERLGTWMGGAGSAASIFSAFGVAP